MICGWQGVPVGCSPPAQLPGVSLPTSYVWCFCWLQPGSGRCGSQGSFPLLSAQAEKSPSSEDMSRPLGELQEAVEMLNDAAKERERVMEVAAETENLEHLVGNGGWGPGHTAGWFICSWTCRLTGTGHALQLSSVGHKSIGIHGDRSVRGWHPCLSHGWHLPFCSCMAGCPQAGVGWGYVAGTGASTPGLISLCVPSCPSRWRRYPHSWKPFSAEPRRCLKTLP